MPRYELWLTLPVGDHTLRVRATDAAASPLTSDPLSVTVTVQTPTPAAPFPYDRELPPVTWRIVLFDRNGRSLGVIDDCQQPKLSYVLNGVDSFSCALPLDHRNAGVCISAATHVKVWRTVRGQSADAAHPSFAGIVLPISEGSGNIFNITAFSPMKMLEARYVWAPLSYADKKGRATIDQSEIIHRLLDYTNARGDTGIIWGSAPATALRPRKYEVGQQISQAITDIVDTLGGVDLFPQYAHTENSPVLMRLSTLTARGSYRANARIDYYVGTKNAADATRQFTTDPGTFATFVGVVGQGETPVSANRWDDGAIGLYGVWERFESLSNATTAIEVQATADSILRQSKQPLQTIQPVLGVGEGPWYGRDYEVGDVIPVAARRGRMTYYQYQRVYEANLGRTDNMQETVELKLAADFDQVVQGVPTA